MTRKYIEDMISYLRKQQIMESNTKLNEAYNNLIKYLLEVLKCLK